MAETLVAVVVVASIRFHTFDDEELQLRKQGGKLLVPQYFMLFLAGVFVQNIYFKIYASAHSSFWRRRRSNDYLCQATKYPRRQR